MTSDSDIVTRLREILKDSDLDKATAGSVRRQLEKGFGVDLSDRKAFIRSQIDIYLETLGKDEEKPGEEDITDNVEENEEENDEGGDAGGEGEDEEEEGSTGQETDTKGSGKGEKEVKKRGGGGFTKLCSLSPKLQNLVGEPQLARTQVVKKLWAYIREKNLQDPKDKRIIKCDEPLRDLFRVNSINMFQMNKALSKHIWPLTPEAENETLKVKGEDSDSSVSEGDDPEGKEEEEQEQEEGEGEEEEEVEKDCSDRSKKKGRSAKVDKNVKKRGGGGFSKLCSLSPVLQVVTGAPELARTEVVKRIWAYIREKNLQDPKNKRRILCDESMRAVFQVDFIDMFQMNKALSAHIWPLNKEDGPDKSLQEDKNCKREREEDLDEPEQKQKQQKEGSSGL